MGHFIWNQITSTLILYESALEEYKHICMGTVWYSYNRPWHSMSSCCYQAWLKACHRHKESEEKRVVIFEEVNKLKYVGFIREIIYLTYLANIIMVKRTSRWRHLCVNFTDVKWAFPKDPYSFPNIDTLFDKALGFFLS